MLKGGRAGEQREEARLSGGRGPCLVRGWGITRGRLSASGEELEHGWGERHLCEEAEPGTDLGDALASEGISLKNVHREKK